MIVDMNTIVVGSLNTDLVATGLERFPGPGEHVYGDELHIGPGGKSRNIAEMMGHLVEANTVAMVGRTVKDVYGFWKPPLDALADVHVNTDFVVFSENEVNKLPGIAIINVDKTGNNQIVALPGVSNDFSSEDIDNASSLFEDVGKNNGSLVLTLECPPETALHAVKKAKQMGIRVMLDPGGILRSSDLSELLTSGIYLLKPNEHEAKILTDIEVRDLDSAQRAASMLLSKGIEVVLITHGENGAYLFSGNKKLHIPISDVHETGKRDATGCGDQTMATLCAELQSGKPIEEATTTAILAGTLQFHRVGIQPIKKEELSSTPAR